MLAADEPVDDADDNVDGVLRAAVFVVAAVPGVAIIAGESLCEVALWFESHRCVAVLLFGVLTLTLDWLPAPALLLPLSNKS